MACEDLAREALEPFAKAADKLPSSVWNDLEEAPGTLTVGDLRRARTAYDAIGSGVKALEWKERDWGRASWVAATQVGLEYYVGDREGVTAWWQFLEKRNPAASIDEAKAAAQADFERRVLSCLSTHTAAGAGPVGDCDICHGKTVATEPGEVLLYDQDNCPGCSPAATHHAEKPAGPVGEAVESNRSIAIRCVEKAGVTPESGHWIYAVQAAEAALAYTRTVEEPGEVERLTRERDHWKANHDEMVARNAVLRDRPDLPADRLPALARIEARAKAAEAALAETRERITKEANRLTREVVRLQGLVRDATVLVPLAHQNWHADARAALTGNAQEGGR